MEELKINPYGQVTISQEEACEALYSKKITDLKNVYIDLDSVVDQYNQARTINADRIPALAVLQEPQVSQSEFDHQNQQHWFMPDQYKNMDIEQFVFDQCPEQNRNRAAEELELFQARGMYDLLRYIKYLVDTMRSNNIVWGVGRGSSVASYVLYLIGIHKINSILYQLDIHEFLK